MFTLRKDDSTKFVKYYIDDAASGVSFKINKHLFTTLENSAQEELQTLWDEMAEARRLKNRAKRQRATDKRREKGATARVNKPKKVKQEKPKREKKSAAEKKQTRSERVKKYPFYCFLDNETDGFTTLPLATQFKVNHPLLTTDEQEAQIFTTSRRCGDCVEPALDAVCAMFNKVRDRAYNNMVYMYIHNTAFDLPRLFHTIRNIKLKPVCSGSSIIKAEMIYNGVTFMVFDSFRMMQGSLSSLAKSFLPSKIINGVDVNRKFEMDHSIGFSRNNKQHVEYALQDVIILERVVFAYADVLKTEPFKLSSTAAGQTFKMMTADYKQREGKEFKGAYKNVNLFFQNHAYMGGRVYMQEGVPLNKVHNVVSYDITSSYPYEMLTQEFPVGVNPKVGKTLPAKVGRYFVKMAVRDYFPGKLKILPHRVVNPVDGLKETTIYPEGDFTTIVTDGEFSFYLKHRGGSTYEVLEYLYWLPEECAPVLRPYVLKMKGMKEEGDALNKIEPGSGDAMRSTGKLLMNSLYGKLAQTYFLEDTPGYVREDGVGRRATAEEEEEFWMTKKKKGVADQRNAFISAFITAGARLNLYRPFVDFGEEAIVYGDTDSVKILKEVFDRVVAEKGLPDYFQGKEFGNWKNEGVHEMVMAAPKVYMFRHKDENGVYRYELKSKGFSTNSLVRLIVGDTEYIEPDIPAYLTAKTKERKRREWKERILELIFEGLKEGKSIVGHYTEQPAAFKSAMKDPKQIAVYRTKSLYDPNSTGAYEYDAVEGCYRAVVLKDSALKGDYHSWLGFYRDMYPFKQGVEVSAEAVCEKYPQRLI